MYGVCIKETLILYVILLNRTKMNLTLLLTLLFKTTQGRVFDDTRMLTVVGSLLDQATDSHGVYEPVTGARVGY